MKDREVSLTINTYKRQMETTKILERERNNKDAVHFHWNEADETWNAYGKSAENALAINRELRTLTDKAELDGTEVTHLKVTTEQFERYGLADYCVAVDDERLKLKIPVHG